MVTFRDMDEIEEKVRSIIKPLRERVEDLEQLNKSIVRQVVELREAFNRHMLI